MVIVSGRETYNGKEWAREGNTNLSAFHVQTDTPPFRLPGTLPFRSIFTTSNIYSGIPSKTKRMIAPRATKRLVLT